MPRRILICFVETVLNAPINRPNGLRLAISVGAVREPPLPVQPFPTFSHHPAIFVYPHLPIHNFPKQALPILGAVYGKGGFETRPYGCNRIHRGDGVFQDRIS
jgi:hypothetical protein